MKSTLILATRGSKLALFQAELVRAKLGETCPLVTVELKIVKTKGDMIRRGALSAIASRGIFTREIEETLLAREADLAVHSAKDLPTELDAHLSIGAVLKREDHRDCLVTFNGKTLDALPHAAAIGTSSIRRKAQLLRYRPHTKIVDVRGNIDTRIRKLREGVCDALVVAQAGLMRLGLGNLITETLNDELFLPQAAQGAIAVEIRAGDREMEEVMQPINHVDSATQVQAERAFLRRLQGGCQIPIGVAARIPGRTLDVRGEILSLSGERHVQGALSGPREKAEALGVQLAEQLLAQGGSDILEEIRHAKEATSTNT